MIPVGKKGRIVQGVHAGWFVFIQDDSASTGGFLILIAEDKDFKGQGFDSWVENQDKLEQYFRYANWQIDWLE